MAKSKICRVCNEDKRAKEFRRKAVNSDGLSHTCRSCCQQQENERYRTKNAAFQLAVGDRVAARDCDKEVLHALVCRVIGDEVIYRHCSSYPNEKPLGYVEAVDLDKGVVKVEGRWISIRHVSAYPEASVIQQRAWAIRGF